MIEVLEKYIPHVIAALTQAGPDGLTVKELRGHSAPENSSLDGP
jgi:hypothetical protein